MTSEPLRVLVIDDSAVVRQTLAKLLAEHGGMRVTVAADPLFALAKIRRERPDVILLDLQLPRMDGLSFLSELMAEDPIPVVICSALTGGRSDMALTALERGAVDIVTKPKLGVKDFLHDTVISIVDIVRAAAASQPASSAACRPRAVAPLRVRSSSARASVVAVGASTGGTDALVRFLSRMPSDGPGLVIVQHMPQGFTAAFARRLDELCAIHVREASEGDVLEPGVALIAAGNRHLRLCERRGQKYRVSLEDGPLVSRHRPSVDVLFHSVARTAGADAVGVIMTGMGSDGAEGLLAMRTAGATTLAQDEASCVVFGMPRVAIERGAVQSVLPLEELPEAVLSA
ncbi:MAG TPA: chemotaxis response regulator protein-glutamate methylesterase [Polyangiaceae bacterium]|nr:chemotaxis response regulator protein-glutamate methylesterase [Polyangiaceae bacterium]